MTDKKKKRHIILPGEENLSEEELEAIEQDTVEIEIDEDGPVTVSREEFNTFQAAAEKCSELEDQLKRLQAEFANFQQRARRESATREQYMNENILRDLIPALDAFDQSKAQLDNAGDSSSIAEGIELIERELRRILQQHGLEQIDLDEGDEFDPNEHEALSMQPTDEQDPNTIVTIFRAGYRLHERIIRPAQVIVASAPPKE